MHLVTVCGSLRDRSSNRAILRAYERLAPPDVTITHYDGVGRLPHFNPDADVAGAPEEVTRLRRLVAAADAVVISTPEYAHALPGAFKNALDWLVSDPALVGRRVVILSADRGSTWAADSLREVLRTMSAEVDEGASVSLPLNTNSLDENQILARPDLRELLARSWGELLRR